MMPFIGILVRTTGVAIGVILIAIGAPLLFTPIPVGLLLITLGLLTLVVSSTHARDWLRRKRQQHRQFDARLRRIENGMPRLLRGLLVGTRPADAD